MLKKLGLVDLHVAIKNKIEQRTNMSAFDHVEKDTPSPFYYLEIVNKREEDTKSMWAEVITVWIHAIAEKSDSKLQIYDMIQNLEEALTEEIELPEHVTLLRQVNAGLQTLQKDETGEFHAVLVYEFKVAYGFKAKNI